MPTPPAASPARGGVGRGQTRPAWVRLLPASTDAAHDATGALVLPGPLDTTAAVVRVVAVQGRLLAAFAAVIGADPAQAALGGVGNLAGGAWSARDDLAAWGRRRRPRCRRSPISTPAAVPAPATSSKAPASAFDHSHRMRPACCDGPGGPVGGVQAGWGERGRWPAFVRWLEQRPAAQRDDVVRGAVQTFEWLAAVARSGDSPPR